jgi:hypothetical protein
MKKKTNINFILYIKLLYNKICNMNIYILLLKIYKIKIYINLILKFILLFMIVSANSNELSSIWDFFDVALKIVEHSNIKTPAEPSVIEVVDDGNTKPYTKEEEEALKALALRKKLGAMDTTQFLEYAYENEPAIYWALVTASVCTTVVCCLIIYYTLTPPNY